MKHIKYSKSIDWLVPYVECAKGLVNLNKLKVVTTFKVPVSKIKQTEACLIRYDAKNYKITLTLYNQKRKRVNSKIKIKSVKNTISFVLDSLAHELAHLKYFDHRPEHLALQARILIRMTKVAKLQGILDLDRQWKKFK